MRDWDGVDRRAPDPWRTQLEGRMREMEKDLRETRKDMRCVQETWEAFQRDYGDLLKETLKARADRAKLWSAATEKLVSNGIWAAIALLALALWNYFIGNLHK